MVPEKAFNKVIQSYLDNQPNSNASKTIRIIQSHAKRKTGFYGMFDDVGYRLGIGISATAFLNSNGKLAGYIPYLIYSPQNLVGEEQGEIPLRDKKFPMELDDCYKILAKELLYRIERIPNLEELLK